MPHDTQTPLSVRYTLCTYGVSYSEGFLGRLVWFDSQEQAAAGGTPKGGEQAFPVSPYNVLWRHVRYTHCMCMWDVSYRGTLVTVLKLEPGVVVTLDDSLPKVCGVAGYILKASHAFSSRPQK
jgi:hypothetical protein